MPFFHLTAVPFAIFPATIFAPTQQLFDLDGS